MEHDIDHSDITDLVRGHGEPVHASYPPAAAPVAERVSDNSVLVRYPIFEEWQPPSFFGDHRAGRFVEAAPMGSVEIVGDDGVLHAIPPEDVADVAAWAAATASDHAAWERGEVCSVVCEHWSMVDDRRPVLVDVQVDRSYVSLETACASIPRQDDGEGPDLVRDARSAFPTASLT